MFFPRLIIFILFMLLLAQPCGATPDSLARVTEKWKGDLPDVLKEHRPLRVLVSYNRTNFFLVHGAMRGLEYDLMQAYNKYVVKKHKSDHLRMVFVAVPFDELIPALLDGRGDIVAAGLTSTTPRRQHVVFSAPYRTGIDEIIIGSKRANPILSHADLAGKNVYVMSGSSYGAHLRTINQTLHRRGMKLVKIVEADPHLVTEDLLEMAERGIIDYAVADSHIAEIWKKALPNLQLFTKDPIHTGGTIAWAVRPGNKVLRESLSDFAVTVRQGTLMGNMVFKRYFVNSDWVKNPNAQQDRLRLEKLRGFFEKYAKLYDFDWLKLAALAFQESRFDMESKSSVGAIGVMQVRPSTAMDPNVNIKNFDTLEGNIHAGTKYLRFLRDNYFQDVAIEARVDFALAAYNAGPARIIGLRKVAKQMGLNPNLWFGNVEWAACKEIGTETPTYVANVQMYYAAYKSIYEAVSNRNDVMK